MSDDWTVTTPWRVYVRDRAGVGAGDVEARLEPPGETRPGVERRAVVVTNRRAAARTIEVTLYAELVLFPLAAHEAHPAFAKLFVQTELSDEGVVLAGRRPRGRGERTMWLAATLGGDGQLEVETDRARFIGRGRTLERPAALVSDAPLSGTVGNVLDPVVALRRVVHVEAGASFTLELVTATGGSRDEALSQISATLPHLSPLGRDGSSPTRPASQTPGRAAGAGCERPADVHMRASRPTGGGREPGTGETPRAPANDLLFPNTYGGFSADGREYVIRVAGPHRPPMPWINVVANDRFGFLVSETGAGTTWSENSRQNRLTPWSNDPIIDPHGEPLSIRDEDDGACWSPQPGTADDDGVYEVRHGFGYSRWTHASHGLAHEVTAFVPVADPVKITLVRLTNAGDRARRLTVRAAQDLVLGVLPSETARAIRTELDAETGAALARNPRREEFSKNVAFATGVAVTAQVRCGAERAGVSPCFTEEVALEIPAGASASCAFLLGEAASDDEVRELLTRYASVDACVRALDEAKWFWSELVSAVQVETPSRELDLLLNGWLLYQVLSCRIRGRSAFYQSGGAFGFRDQLQDSAGLVYARPDLMRAQIVLHAGRQFLEGDVQHWWHPPAGRGTRTRCSDDLVWLPYLTAFYVGTTGDASVLDERAGFLTARTLEPGEDEAYLLPSAAGTDATVYDHCVRALDRSLAVGANGLPLIGTCDWNDGFNRVGREGRGESVWLALFLHATLEAFEPLCERCGERDRAARYAAHRGKLRAAIEEHAWDGGWYRRATYDDGAWLGTSNNPECRIDALAQSWAVISKAARPERARHAMDAAEKHLVDENAGLIRLLTPPFDRAPEDPGYIKGYVPGIRENGGQYTHGALWIVRATAELGRRDRAAKLLEMLTPIAHSRDRAAADVYKVEPYVVVADVYGAAPHVGRGGWTWYTGSAAWMYRVALESILGFTIEGGETLSLRPCVPDDWPRFSLRYRLPDGKTRYDIAVENPTRRAASVTAMTLDGAPGEVRDGAARVPLVRDGRAHRVVVDLG